MDYLTDKNLAATIIAARGTAEHAPLLKEAARRAKARVSVIETGLRAGRSLTDALANL